MYSPQPQTSTHPLHMVNDASVSSPNTDSTNINLNSPLNLNGGQDVDINNNNTSSSINNNNNNNNDQYSLSSSISQSSYNSRTDNSLIFERLVQDPLTDIHPPSLPRNRNITTETFIPASLDATTQLIKDEEFVIEEPLQFGFSSRRSSLANLEAALGPSRRASVMNTPRTLSRSNTNTSLSNLTQQFQNAAKQHQDTYQQPQAPLVSRSSSQLSNLPPLTTTLSASSSAQRNSTSPIVNDKCFCSYADIIAQEDHESRFTIRRPSLSASFSGIKLERGNSTSSTLNSPRSPPVSSNGRTTSSSTTNRFRQNSGFNIAFNSSSFGPVTTNATSPNNTNSNKSHLINSSSPMNNINNNSISSFNSAIDDEAELFIHTPKKLGFSGRSLSNYSNRVTNIPGNSPPNISPQISKQES